MLSECGAYEMPGDDYCYVKTRGRVTGRSHEIEIWYALDGDTLYVLSGGGSRSDWVKNLAKTPECVVRIGVDGPELGATARVLETGSTESIRARHLLFDKYATRYSGDLSDWRDSALAVAFDLGPPLTSKQ